MSIQAIDTTSIHRLTSGQVVTSLQTAIKELVDNALDARATSVEVRFRDLGLESIEVVDNGSGIPKKDYESIALKHHTSKLSTFSDLLSVRTLGFRGEALGSLCALCESVEVITATGEEAPVGTRIKFDKAGRVISADETVARTRGTTIILQGLFAPTPVRLTELQKHIKREFAKAVTLLQGYALVAPTVPDVAGEPRGKAKGVRWSVVSFAPKGGKKTVHLKTDGSTNLRATLSSVWGPKATDGLVEIDFEVDLPSTSDEGGAEVESPVGRTCRVHGLLSSPTQSARSSADRQFYSINFRPFVPTKLSKAVNDTWRSLNPAQYPVVVLNLSLPPDAFDVNVSPDKRTVFFHDELLLMEGIRAKILDKFSASSSTVSFAVNALQPKAKAPVAPPLPLLRQTKLGSMFKPAVALSDSNDAEEDADVALDEDDDLSLQETVAESNASPSRPRQASPTSSPPPLSPSSRPRATSPIAGRPSRSPSPFGSVQSSPPPSLPLLSAFASSLPSASRQSSPSRPVSAQHLSPIAQGKQRQRADPVAVMKVDLESLQRRRRVRTPGTSLSSRGQGERVQDASLDEVEERPVPGLKRPISPIPSPHNSSGKDELDPVVPARRRDVPPQPDHQLPTSSAPSNRRPKSRTIACDQGKIFNRLRASRPKPSPRLVVKVEEVEPDAIISGLASVDAPADVAERALSRTILKSDFAAMEILGQFNLGFIVARKQSPPTGSTSDDLFIIDQHASDEKFNFETLQNETRIQSQGLIQPRVLELSAVDVELVQDNMEVLKRNGFEVGVQESISLDDDDDAGRTIVTLRAQPISKETVFDFSDFEELLHLMKDQPSGQMVRCSKARRMFAMRACRKSVMIGRALTKPQMTKVVRNLGLLDQPWNCPHGRPTMRHLTNLTDVVKRRRKERKVDWEAVLAETQDGE